MFRDNNELRLVNVTETSKFINFCQIMVLTDEYELKQPFSHCRQYRDIPSYQLSMRIAQFIKTQDRMIFV